LSFERSIFVDPSRCIACGACVAACRECDTHRGKSMMNLDVVDRSHSTAALPTVCMHCVDPVAPCAQVCPVDAILVSSDGVVHSPDASRCIGCQNCVHGCPWGVPKFDAEEQLAYKCNLCYDRTSVGLGPMCATVCPSDALYYGTAEEVLASRPRRQVIDVFGFGQQELQSGNWMVVPEDFSLAALPLVAP
jgi:Fe-S-cluster-containing dehydrogenase component